VWFGLQKKRYHLQIHEQTPSGISGKYDLKKHRFRVEIQNEKKRKKDNIRNFWSSLKTYSVMFEGKHMRVP